MRIGQYDSRLGGKPARDLSLPVYAERQIEDCGAFGVFWYRRPSGHTKTGARHRGETPWVTEWSFVRRNPDDSWAVGQAKSGYESREAAIESACEQS